MGSSLGKVIDVKELQLLKVTREIQPEKIWDIFSIKRSSLGKIIEVILEQLVNICCIVVTLLNSEGNITDVKFSQWKNVRRQLLTNGNSEGNITDVKFVQK